MVGPVLHHEMMLGSRRSRAYIFRWIYAGWLVAQVLWFWMQYGMTVLATGTQAYATPTVAEWFVETFVIQQLILMALAMLDSWLTPRGHRSSVLTRLRAWLSW